MMFIFSWTASSPDRTLLRDYKVNLKGNDLFLVEETKKSLLGVADQPFAMEAHFRYAAIALINASLNEEAILLLKKGHAIYSKDYGILDGLASTLEKSGRQEEAIPYREKQVKLEARSPLVWMNLALDYNSVGRTMDARSALKEALKFQRFVPSELTDQFTKAQNVILP
jgi:tetratricopeptide (TPR) repeat protein